MVPTEPHSQKKPVLLMLEDSEIELITQAAKKETRARINFIRKASLDRAKEVLQNG